MVEEFEITILTDKTSWMNEYNVELANKLYRWTDRIEKFVA